MINPRILIVEDDIALADQAMMLLRNAAYDPCSLDVTKVMELDYWKSCQITSQDLVVLDLNFRLADVRYSGKEVLRVLEQGKKAGDLQQLEQILVATSMKSEVDPKQVSPDIAFIDERIKMYGLEKGVHPITRLVDLQGYGTSLLTTIKEIYQGKRTVLNKS